LSASEGIDCARCGAPLRAGASFCPGCGARAGAELREPEAEQGAVVATLLCFAGVLLVLIASAALQDEVLFEFAVYGGFVGLGLAGCAALGRGSFRASLGGAPGERWVAAGLAGGLVCIAINWSYVATLGALIGAEDVAGPEPGPLWLDLLTTATLTPLLEEWLCRGVLLVACARLMGDRSALLVTSALFALLHGLEAYVLSVPHRFASGLVFGWLRLRSGSLVPGVIAHAVNNAFAVVMPG